jgi:hypothetical protein
MNTVTEYDLIMKRSPTEIILEVNRLIKRGWFPIGGISINEHNYYCQVMVRYED